MFKQKEIIMLPAEIDGNIGDFIISMHDHSSYLGCGIKRCEPYNMSETRQHLYVLSDEPIQVGDAVYSKRGVIGIFGKFENSYIDECQKIIASTDDFLYVPKIPNSFVKDFVNLYNQDQQIKNVEVAYVDMGEEEWDGDGITGEPFWNEILSPFIKSDGTVNIKIPERKKTNVQLISGLDRFDCNEPVYMKFSGQYGHMVVMNDVPYFIPEHSDGMDVEDVSEHFDVVKETLIKGV